MLPATLGVIGLGPVGGSIAWGAARRGVQRVLGWSADTRDGVAAVRDGALTELAHDPGSICSRAEVVVFATAPADTARLLRQYAPGLIRRGVVCTDVSAVKRPIVDLATQLGLGGVFAGSHPLVDDVASGFAGAGPDRLRGALVYVTPVEGGHAAADEVRDFWSRSVGADPVVLSPDRHDDIVAWTEQLPRAVAAALACALAAGRPAGVTVPRAVLDATRSADADPQRWTAVLLANRERLLPVIETFLAESHDLRAVLEAGDRERLQSWLERAARWRRAQPS